MSSGHFNVPIGERNQLLSLAKQLTPSMVLKIPKVMFLIFVAKKEAVFTSHAQHYISPFLWCVPIIFGGYIKKKWNAHRCS